MSPSVIVYRFLYVSSKSFSFSASDTGALACGIDLFGALVEKLNTQLRDGGGKSKVDRTVPVRLCSGLRTAVGLSKSLTS